VAREPEPPRMRDPLAVADDEVRRLAERLEERKERGDLAEREEAGDVRERRAVLPREPLDRLEPGPREDDDAGEDAIAPDAEREVGGGDPPDGEAAARESEPRPEPRLDRDGFGDVDVPRMEMADPRRPLPIDSAAARGIRCKAIMARDDSKGGGADR